MRNVTTLTIVPLLVVSCVSPPPRKRSAAKPKADVAALRHAQDGDTELVEGVAETAREAPPTRPKAKVLYVSPRGDDANAGTEDGPFRSPDRARDEIRRLKKGGVRPEGGFVVELMPGTYRLDEPFELGAGDGGTEAAPVVYRAQKRGTAILSGGVLLDRPSRASGPFSKSNGWRPVRDSRIRSLLRDEARDAVRWAELDAALFDPSRASGSFSKSNDAIPGFANGGCGYRGEPEYPIALYQENARLPIARWPNHGYVKTGECVGKTREWGRGTTFTEGVFRFADDRLARWAGEPDLWLDGLWFWHWADQKMRLKAIDLAAKTISLEKPETHAYGFKAGQDFYAFNGLSEIDIPGEWAVDRANRRVYLWPADDLGASPVVAAVHERLLVAEQTAHVNLQDIVFEACTRVALTIKDCKVVVISGCTVRHTGSWAVRIDGGSDCTVFGCDLYDLGEGGVWARGGVRDTLTPGSHVVENNHIHHFGRIVSTYRPGAAVYGVGNKIRHNLIYEAQHQAVFYDGNDHVIEYNILHDICLHSSDAGGIYACARDWSERGTVIRHNLIHALGEGLDGCGCRAIYLDDHTSGASIQSNIVTKSAAGINLGGGKDNIIAGNIALGCDVSVSLSSRGVDSFARKDAAKGRESGCFRKLLKDEKLFRTALWRARYPKLLDVMDMDPVDAQNAHGNTIKGNVAAGSGPVSVRNEKVVMRTCVVEDNPVLDDDPGFASLTGLDLRLRPDAPVRGTLREFEAPEFEKMGLYDDPRRASPAVKFGPDVTPMPPVMSPKERELAKMSLLFGVPVAPTGIRVDGTIAPAERPPGRGGSPALLEWGPDRKKVPYPSRAWLSADTSGLYVAVENDIDPARRATDRHAWGRDDGIEIALAPARESRLPSRVATRVFRGYADGFFESVTDGGLPEDEARQARRGVAYAASRSAKGSWTAEWRIPFTSLGTDPKETNWPILAHITVRKPAEGLTVGWRRRWSRDTWSVRGAYALCMEVFGDVPFAPGRLLPSARIDIQADRKKRGTLEPGPGAAEPGWAVNWNRLVATFGTVRADRWKTCRFEFTPREDASVRLEVMGTQTKGSQEFVWTYYDDFRVEGAELVNGDFEVVGADDRLAGWNCVMDRNWQVGGDARSGARALAGRAASGSHVAVATHDHRVTQALDVKKGRTVRVTFRARGALPRANTSETSTPRTPIGRARVGPPE